MVERKPVLFLDVDGVLNVFARGYQKRVIELPGKKFPHRIYPSKHTIPFMRWAWSTFEVFWCTAWGEDANVIADWAKLEHRPSAVDRKSVKMDWKLAGVQAVLRRAKRPAAWIEDGIGEEAEAWVAKQKNFHYIFTHFKVGVTKTHAKYLADALGLSMEAWNGKR